MKTVSSLIKDVMMNVLSIHSMSSMELPVEPGLMSKTKNNMTYVATTILLIAFEDAVIAGLDSKEGVMSCFFDSS
jgi:hypothetical protein